MAGSKSPSCTASFVTGVGEGREGGPAVFPGAPPADRREEQRSE